MPSQTNYNEALDSFFNHCIDLIYSETNHPADSIECAGAAEGVGALEPEPEQHHLHPHSCLPWMPQGLIGSAMLTKIFLEIWIG